LSKTKLLLASDVELHQ